MRTRLSYFYFLFFIPSRRDVAVGTAEHGRSRGAPQGVSTTELDGGGAGNTNESALIARGRAGCGERLLLDRHVVVVVVVVDDVVHTLLPRQRAAT